MSSLIRKGVGFHHQLDRHNNLTPTSRRRRSRSSAYVNSRRKSKIRISCVKVTVLCHAARSGLGFQWNRSLKRKERKLARQIADALEESGHDVLSEHGINAFVERIGDRKARGAAMEIFRGGISVGIQPGVPATEL